MNSVLSGRRVLVMEDEMLMAWALEDLLADLGCIVVGPAARVDKALALLQAEAVDLAMLDVNLSGQRSYAVADALAAKGVPFVFLSGYTRDSLPGCYHARPMLQKPFRPSELGDALAKLLALEKLSL